MALAATQLNDGIVRIPGVSATGVFAVATVNVGAAGSITISPGRGGKGLPLTLSVCQTDPPTGACLGPPSARRDRARGAAANAGRRLLTFRPGVGVEAGWWSGQLTEQPSVDGQAEVR